jgi:hypothetical protein
MRELTSQEMELVREGQLAEEALSNPSIASAINELSAHLSNKIISTPLGGTAEREKYYFLHAALTELVAILNSRIGLKKNIEAQADQENE